VTVPEGAWAVGRTLAEVALDRWDVSVTALRRRSIRSADPPPESRLEAGDSLVLRGTAEAVDLAEQALLAPGFLNA
jgi:CPA2 family monovalent cation:H+ antiporter-2